MAQKVVRGVPVPERVLANIRSEGGGPDSPSAQRWALHRTLDRHGERQGAEQTEHFKKELDAIIKEADK